MSKEIGLYDILAYFVTGAVALGSIIAATQSFQRIRPQESKAERQSRSVRTRVSPGESRRTTNSFWESDTKLFVLLFIIVSYVVGNLIQAGVDSARLMGPSDNTITAHYKNDPEFGEKLKTAVNTVFHNPPEGQFIKLCQTYSHVRNIDTSIQIMLAYYALSKGLTIALFIGGLAFICRGVKEIWHYFSTFKKRRGRAINRAIKSCGEALQGRVRRKSRWRGAFRNLFSRKNFFRLAPLLISALFFIGADLSYRRSKQFSDDFVEHVYRTFYVSYSLSETENGQKSLPPRPFSK